MALRALIFDVDGTLADTERDGHRVAFNAAFAEAGLSWHWNEVLYGELLAVAGGIERLVHYARACEPAVRSEDELQHLVARLHASKTRHYVRHDSAGAVPLRPGVARLIAETRRCGLRLAIATSTTRANVTALLQATLDARASDIFDVIGTAQEVALKKPDPAVYRWVLKELGVPAQDALALEDSRIGLLAATRAGIACIVTPTAYSAAEDLSEARVRLTDFEHHPEAPHQPVTLSDLRRWHAAPIPGCLR